MATRQQTDVLASAAAGDEIAFSASSPHTTTDMRRVCAYIAGDLAIAEEATQAAWAIAWKKLRDVREPEQLRPWLMRSPPTRPSSSCASAAHGPSSRSRPTLPGSREASIPPPA